MVILYIFVGIIGLSVGFNVLTRKYINPYRLYLVFGKKGSGKSTYLVKLALRYMRKNWYVYTNMTDIMIPGVRVFNVDHLGNFVPEKNSVLLIDEVGMIWDARDYKKFQPCVRDFFKLQRHYRVLVYMASQTFDVDKKLRDLTDGMFLNVDIKRIFSIGKRIVKKIVLTESTSEAESRISENLAYAPIWTWTFTFIPKYAKYFDSHLVPELPSLPYEERKKVVT
ncbi:MAG: zonular occludens toxin domain-containing protein [Clostridiaceae bacterium]|nr:zonular occludens toxin domain-containing protein [Clostridiaceae bacterium]